MPTPTPGAPRPQASQARPTEERVPRMSIAPEALHAFMQEMSCTEEEADAEIRRRLRGVLKHRGKLYPGLRPNSWRLHQYRPGGKRYMIISFNRERVTYVGVRDVPGRKGA